MSMENVNNMMMYGMESLAQISIGQAVLKLVDRILWIVEKSVQWSIPTPELTAEENGKSFGKVELVRPLPWIFFLPSLLFLRIIRYGINTTASVLGYPKVEASDMVRAIQRGRRRIRSIKSNGMKSIRQRKLPTLKDRTMTMKEASKSLAKSIRLTLSTLSCLDSGSKTSPSPPPTKIRVSNILDGGPPMTEEKVSTESMLRSPQADSKRKYSEISSDSSDDSNEEPLISRIDRLANYSGSDKDFSPSDLTSDVTTSSDDDEEEDVSISWSEVQDLKSEKEEMMKICNSYLNNKDTILEDDLHKLTESLIASEKLLVERREIKPCQLSPATAENHMTTTNGDTAYYSPVSWKSVSPDITSEKQDNQIDAEVKPEEISNGEVAEKEIKDNDSNKPLVETGAEVTNGHIQEKQRTSSQSGGNNKHHHKNKRGNHGNRKKK